MVRLRVHALRAEHVVCQLWSQHVGIEPCLVPEFKFESWPPGFTPCLPIRHPTSELNCLPMLVGHVFLKGQSLNRWNDELPDSCRTIL